MYSIEEIKLMEKEERAEVLSLLAKLKKKKAQVVSNVERIPKNGYHEFHKYHYSTESDIKDGIRQILTEAGLTLDIELVDNTKALVDTKQGKQWLHLVTMDFTLTDNETGYMDIKTYKGEATDSGDKGLYKAYTGCLKYYLLTSFLISTGEKENDPESGESDQVHSKGNQSGNNGNRGNNNRNGNRGNNNNQNQQGSKNDSNGSNSGGNGNGNSNAHKATRGTVAAKWKLLTGSEEGLDKYLEEATAKGKSLDDVDKTLLGRIQADAAKKRKEAEEAKKAANREQEPTEGLQYPPLEAGERATDVQNGNTYIHDGKTIILE